MDKYLCQEMKSRVERIRFLQSNADAVEELGYTRELPSDEMAELKEKLVENNIQLRDIRADKKAANKGYNEQIKQLEEQGGELVGKLKSRTEFVTEECYKFVEGDTVGYYNADGKLVYERPARSDERQSTVFSQLRKTGTDN